MIQKRDKVESKSVFEQYLDPDVEHSLPVGTELNFSMNSDSIYGETGYGLESDQAQLHVFPDHDRIVLYVDEDAGSPTNQDEQLIDYAELLSSNWKNERFEPWKERVFENTSISPDYALD